MRRLGYLVRGIAMIALASSGCISRPGVPGSPAPETLSLKLYRSTTDGQHTYFVLSPHGELSFGGGREAMTRTAQLVGTLTDGQRQEIWQVITHHRLTQLKNQAFSKPTKVALHVEIRSPRGGHAYRAIDDESAALKHLHDLLFQMYTTRSYKLPQF